MKNAEKLIQKKYNGIHPICGCGCEEKTVYDHSSKDFGKFKRGHQTRVNKNYFGDPKNPKRVEKIIQTRKEKFASGEYNHIIEAVKENRKDPLLGEKISKGATGVPKPKPEGFGIGRIHSEKTIEKMSESAIERIIRTDQNHTSKLEKTFKDILNQIDGIIYSTHFYAKPIKAFYDFYLPKHNLIIEVDGDFWHCNPSTIHSEAIYESQKKNILRDQEKNEWAKNNGFDIIRFWEYDISNNPEKVLEMLKNKLNTL
jgi:very-short-patch-repair endonuclease